MEMTMAQEDDLIELDDRTDEDLDADTDKDNDVTEDEKTGEDNEKTPVQRLLDTLKKLAQSEAKNARDKLDAMLKNMLQAMLMQQQMHEVNANDLVDVFKQ